MTRSLRSAAFGRWQALILVMLGAAALLGFLYAVGAGWDGRKEQDGGSHAAANGLNGFSALAQLTERQGYSITLSRSEQSLATADLLILTPHHFSEGQEIHDLLVERSYTGPTIVILPKWQAAALPDLPTVDARPGWVQLIAAYPPEWVEALRPLVPVALEMEQGRWWRGLGLEGALPNPQSVQSIAADPALQPLVQDESGRILAAVWTAEDAWPIYFIAEPDLLNNQGLAEQDRALLAMRLLARAMEGEDYPVVFDLTLPGLGRRPNLLTLAFQPPFLAATLCLVLVALVIAWRAFFRFGAATMPEQGLAWAGKKILTRNGAALIERTGRWRLLGGPYAAIRLERLAKILGLRGVPGDAQEAAIIRAMTARGLDSDGFSMALQQLRAARTAPQLLRAARAVTDIERTISR